jgi:hypothetical protein
VKTLSLSQGQLVEQRQAVVGLGQWLVAAAAAALACVRTQSSSHGQLAATQQPAAGLAVLLLPAMG